MRSLRRVQVGGKLSVGDLNAQMDATERHDRLKVGDASYSNGPAGQVIVPHKDLVYALAKFTPSDGFTTYPTFSASRKNYPASLLQSAEWDGATFTEGDLHDQIEVFNLEGHWIPEDTVHEVYQSANGFWWTRIHKARFVRFSTPTAVFTGATLMSFWQGVRPIADGGTTIDVVAETAGDGSPSWIPKVGGRGVAVWAESYYSILDYDCP